MQKGIRNGAMLLLLAVSLAACGSRNREPNLLTIESNTPGPDEFAILPSKPLQAPEDYANLPEPTPGGSNLSDPTPRQDAIAALGGRPELIHRSGQFGPDGGLINYAGRYGVAADIRSQLATADYAFRSKQRGRLLERVFNVNRYNRAYQDLSLDQYAELLRLRRLGIRTPAVPPEPIPE